MNDGGLPIAGGSSHAFKSLPLLRLSDGQLEALKWLALVSMLVDHFGRYAFGLGTDSWAFSVGRLAFPLFAFVLASNLARPGERVHRAWRTSRRLAIWAVVSALPSWWARDAWLPVNVLVTLAISAGLCGVLEARWSPLSQAFACVGGVTLALVAEFSFPGVLFVVCLQRALAGGSSAALLLAASMLALTAGVNMSFGGATAAVLTMASLPVVLAARFGSCDPRRIKWAFYLTYPLHLLAIGILARSLGG
jgi:hypothetical protein